MSPLHGIGAWPLLPSELYTRKKQVHVDFNFRSRLFCTSLGASAPCRPRRRPLLRPLRLLRRQTQTQSCLPKGQISRVRPRFLSNAYLFQTRRKTRMTRSRLLSPLLLQLLPPLLSLRQRSHRRQSLSRRLSLRRTLTLLKRSPPLLTESQQVRQSQRHLSLPSLQRPESPQQQQQQQRLPLLRQQLLLQLIRMTRFVHVALVYLCCFGLLPCLTLPPAFDRRRAPQEARRAFWYCHTISE